MSEKCKEHTKGQITVKEGTDKKTKQKNIRNKTKEHGTFAFLFTNLESFDQP